MEQIVKIFLAVIFALAAVAKFFPKTKTIFEKSGYSQRFMYAIAFAEVFFVFGLFSRYDLLAVVGMLGMISGAIITLIRQQASPVNYGMAILSIVLLVTLAIQLTGLQ